MSTRRTAARHHSLVIEIRKFIAGAIFFNQKVAERFELNLTDTQCLNVLEIAVRPLRVSWQPGPA